MIARMFLVVATVGQKSNILILYCHISYNLLFNVLNGHKKCKIWFPLHTGKKQIHCVQLSKCVANI